MIIEKIRKRFMGVLSFALVCAMVSGVCLTAAPGTVKAASIYQDPTKPVEERIKDLLSQMTLDEKVGQMVQGERGLIYTSDVKDYYLGSVLSGGGSAPINNTAKGWADMVDGFQKAAMSTRLQIPIMYGVDAVHGHNNAYGATIFPHNIGLGATRDANLVKQIGQVVAKEVKATGVHWTFAPCIAVPLDERWGRTYEGFGANTDLVTELGVAYTKGFQGDNYLTDLKRNDKIAACLKHFIGDGATVDGINAGDVDMTEEEIRRILLPPYIEALKAGARTVMISYNTIKGLECHANGHIINDILKDELKFDGFVVSDWDGIDDNDRSSYRNCIKLAVNAGIDMFMCPTQWKDVIGDLKRLVASGDVTQARIDDAVTRILRVKFQMGLFENPYADRTLLPSFGSEPHRALAREAVRKSAVLLKNDNILPLPKGGKKIYVTGKCANDIGMQCGGWTALWQGLQGNITPGTTILDGIKKAVGPTTTVTYDRYGESAAGSDVAVVVVGEFPYAEGRGDKTDLRLDAEDLLTLQRVKSTGVPTVVIIVSGRPMVITDQLKDWDALIEAWLPGTEGDGIADLLFGDYDFTGKLPMKWPVTTSQLPFKDGDGKVPLFDYGFGLSIKPPQGFKIAGYVKPDFSYDAKVAPQVQAGFKAEIVGTGLSALTDDKGYFEIKDVPANLNSYTVKVSKANYLSTNIARITTPVDTVIGTAAEPKPVWAGDIVIDGAQDDAINMVDIMEVAKAFNSTPGDARYIQGVDFNLDNAVNMVDIMIVAAHFNAVVFH